MSVLARPTSGKVVAGVCAALARRFGVDPNTVRLLFVLSCLLPGPQVIVYLVLWAVLPREGSPRAAGRP
ncbi:PspC domain-containing protein [Kineococcus sp. NUM-3379]